VLQYNIAYQKFLQLEVFPKSVIDTELNFYRRQLLPYGVPLDVRR